MKKIFVIIMTACLLASMLCFTAFAADADTTNEPASDVVLRVSALKKDESIVVIQDYKVFEDGWNAAMELADNRKEMNKNNYVRVIVDIYADWHANEDGEFTEDFFNGSGFNWDAIYFQDGVRFTLNMNGHTIDRGITGFWNDEYNGEVMYVDEYADVIINDGTIKGGNSYNGAGGIHIKGGATVTLNNVNVTGNEAQYTHGGGIAIYDGATLMMNGGSIADNLNTIGGSDYYAAGVYVNNSTVIFKGVTFSNNQNGKAGKGTVIYADRNSMVSMNDCKLVGNGTKDSSGKYLGSVSLIELAGNSRADIQNTEFAENGDWYSFPVYERIACLIDVDSTSYLYMDSCTFTNNRTIYLLNVAGGSGEIMNSSFLDNVAHIFYGYSSDSITFTNCVFNRTPFNAGSSTPTFNFLKPDSKVTFVGCDFANSTFNDRSRATFENAPRGKSLRVGSLLGEGSLTTIFVFIALIDSVVSIYMIVLYKKKNAVPATANNATETEDEE